MRSDTQQRKGVALVAYGGLFIVAVVATAVITGWWLSPSSQQLTEVTPAVAEKKSSHSPVAQRALSSLRNLARSGEAGVSYEQYGTHLIGVKVDVEEALRQIPNGRLRHELNLAYQAFVDALLMWSKFTSDYRTIETEGSFSDEEAKRLVKKYSIPVEKNRTVSKINRSAALNAIWAAAAFHINRADESLDE